MNICNYIHMFNLLMYYLHTIHYLQLFVVGKGDVSPPVRRSVPPGVLQNSAHPALFPPIPAGPAAGGVGSSGRRRAHNKAVQPLDDRVSGR